MDSNLKKIIPKCSSLKEESINFILIGQERDDCKGQVYDQILQKWRITIHAF
jgi:hypothetical protein